MDSVWSIAISATTTAWAFLNSGFAAAMLSALGGAFAGAYGAHRIALRAKRRDELAQSLRDINVAITLAYTCANAVLTSKSQHVLPMAATYREQLHRVHEVQKGLQDGTIRGGFHHVEADLTTFPAPIAPIGALRDLLLHRLVVGGRELAAVCAFEQALADLNSMIAKRDRLGAKYREMPPSEMIPRYLGLLLPGGHRDNEYHDLVEGISSYTDDLIFFASTLCDDLCEHGVKVITKYNREFKGERKRLPSVSFDTARERGLLPERDRYADWLAGFRTSITEPSR